MLLIRLSWVSVIEDLQMTLPKQSADVRSTPSDLNYCIFPDQVGTFFRWEAIERILGPDRPDHRAPLSSPLCALAAPPLTLSANTHSVRSIVVWDCASGVS